MKAPAAQAPHRRPMRWCRSAMTIESRRTSGTAWCLLALLILAVFGILAVRTDGARHFIESHLQRRSGLAVTVGATRIGWPYDLVLEDMTLSETDPGIVTAGTVRPLLALDELRIGWRARRGATVRARGGTITLRSGADRRPLPARWAALADIEDPDAIAAWVAAMLGDAVVFECEQMALVWMSADEQVVTTAENVRLLTMPLRVPRRSWRFFELSADQWRRADGSWVSGLWHEWLVSSDATRVRLGYRVAGEAPVTDRAFE